MSTMFAFWWFQWLSGVQPKISPTAWLTQQHNVNKKINSIGTIQQSTICTLSITLLLLLIGRPRYIRLRSTRSWMPSLKIPNYFFCLCPCFWASHPLGISGNYLMIIRPIGVRVSLQYLDHMGAVDKLNPPINQPIRLNNQGDIAMGSPMPSYNSDALTCHPPKEFNNIDLCTWREVFCTGTAFLSPWTIGPFSYNICHNTPSWRQLFFYFVIHMYFQGSRL